jgi:hypothetical protein
MGVWPPEEPKRSNDEVYIASVKREIRARMAGCCLAGIRGNRIRLAALSFVTTGSLEQHNRLATYHNAICLAEGHESSPLRADPARVIEAVLGCPGEASAVFGVSNVDEEDAAAFLRDVCCDWHCLKDGEPLIA